eukprot:755861-Hanusia_phi.AAC.2
MSLKEKTKLSARCSQQATSSHPSSDLGHFYGREITSLVPKGCNLELPPSPDKCFLTDVPK